MSSLQVRLCFQLYQKQQKRLEVPGQLFERYRGYESRPRAVEAPAEDSSGGPGLFAVSGSWQGDISKVVNGDSNESKYQLMFSKVQRAAVVVGRDVDEWIQSGGRNKLRQHSINWLVTPTNLIHSSFLYSFKGVS